MGHEEILLSNTAGQTTPISQEQPEPLTYPIDYDVSFRLYLSATEVAVFVEVAGRPPCLSLS